MDFEKMSKRFGIYQMTKTDINFVDKVYRILKENDIEIFEYEKGENFIKILHSTSFVMEFDFKRRQIDVILDSDMMNDINIFRQEVSHAKQDLKSVFPIIWKSNKFDEIYFSDGFQEFDDIMIKKTSKKENEYKKMTRPDGVLVEVKKNDVAKYKKKGWKTTRKKLKNSINSTKSKKTLEDVFPQSNIDKYYEELDVPSRLILQTPDGTIEIPKNIKQIGILGDLKKLGKEINIRNLYDRSMIVRNITFEKNATIIDVMDGSPPIKFPNNTPVYYEEWSMGDRGSYLIFVEQIGNFGKLATEKDIVEKIR